MLFLATVQKGSREIMDVEADVLRDEVSEASKKGVICGSESEDPHAAPTL